MLRFLFLVLYLMASASTSFTTQPDSTPPPLTDGVGGGLDPNG
jgi:hypothetical protein